MATNRKEIKSRITLLILAIAFVLSACVQAGPFSEYRVGEHFHIEELEFERISDNCMICWDNNDGEMYVYLLEEDDFSKDLLDIYNSAMEYTIISGHFSTAYYDSEKLLLKYKPGSGQKLEQRVLVYWFADNKREYCSLEEAGRYVSDENRWLTISSDSYVEVEYHYVATGNKSDLEYLKQMMRQDTYVDEIRFSNGKYYLYGSGVCKWTVRESVLNDYYKGTDYIKGMTSLSRDVDAEIRITGYSNMTEIREFYRIRNGEVLEESVEHVDNTFSWKIFGFGH